MSGDFWRYLCQAKQAQQDGRIDHARQLLELAHRLADEAARIQIEQWSERLRPAPPLTLATDETPCRPKRRAKAQ
jgi:hypothetical protein